MTLCAFAPRNHNDPLCVLIEKIVDNDTMRRKSLITKAPHCHVIAIAHTQRSNEPTNFDNDPTNRRSVPNKHRTTLFQTSIKKHSINYTLCKCKYNTRI